MLPSRMLSGKAMRMAQSASAMVFMARGTRSSSTDRSLTSDIPKSPVTKLPDQSRYCSRAGLFSPSSARSISSFSGVASRPRIDFAASPGSTWVARKMRIDTANSVSIPPPMRRTHQGTARRRGDPSTGIEIESIRSDRPDSADVTTSKPARSHTKLAAGRTCLARNHSRLPPLRRQPLRRSR